MYNLAKSLAASATTYLSGVFTSNPNANLLQDEIPEYTRDEISHYFLNPEWKSGYMNGYYYGYMPPDDDLAVQLTLISRLIHHRFVSFDYDATELFKPNFLTIDKRVITYKSDLVLLDPRNLESPAVSNNPYRNGSRYKWFCGLIDNFDWNTKLRIPSQNPGRLIRQIRMVGDWSTHQDINLELQIDDTGNPVAPTIREICATVFPVIAHTWTCYRTITEYQINWKISADNPEVLELEFVPDGYHIDNARYSRGCYDAVDE